jgi:hypothetical protein
VRRPTAGRRRTYSPCWPGRVGPPRWTGTGNRFSEWSLGATGRPCPLPEEPRRGVTGRSPASRTDTEPSSR